MKKITIFQENVSPIVIEDLDNRNLEEYTQEISKILENPNITILTTSSCCLIARPPDIKAIVINEINIKENTIKECKKEEQNTNEDIICD